MAKRKRTSPKKLGQAWIDVLVSSTTPLLLIDSERRLTFANRALAEWMGLPLEQILDRLVEYHSEPAEAEPEERGGGVLTGLCPPPAALAGVRVRGTLSCLGRDGRLRHRRGEFLPVDASDGFAVLAVLETRDLAPDEIAKSIAVPPEADALHRQLRQLRRDSAKRYSVAGLAGQSAAMRQVRSQIAAAARSRAHVLIAGNAGSGRSHVAQAIHFASPASTAAALVTLDCRLLTEDMLRRGLDALRRGDGNALPTLLLLEIGQLPASFQRELARLLAPRDRDCQIIATIEFDTTLDGDLQALIGTIAIEIPPLRMRIGDLPLLAQLFLEEANVNSSRQVGSVSPAALEQLALYRWPGEVEELQTLIGEAHSRCQGHEMQVADLPATLHHAAQAAQFAPLPMEMISLEAFMAGIERELVLRALEQAQGNKALAARLLGMTRPRLYRRLVQLELLGEADEEQAELEEEPSDDKD